MAATSVPLLLNAPPAETFAKEELVIVPEFETSRVPVTTSSPPCAAMTPNAALPIFPAAVSTTFFIETSVPPLLNLAPAETMADEELTIVPEFETSRVPVTTSSPPCAAMVPDAALLKFADAVSVTFFAATSFPPLLNPPPAETVAEEELARAPKFETSRVPVMTSSPPCAAMTPDAALSKLPAAVSLMLLAAASIPPLFNPPPAETVAEEELVIAPEFETSRVPVMESSPPCAAMTPDPELSKLPVAVSARFFPATNVPLLLNPPPAETVADEELAMVPEFETSRVPVVTSSPPRAAMTPDATLSKFPIAVSLTSFAATSFPPLRNPPPAETVAKDELVILPKFETSRVPLMASSPPCAAMMPDAELSKIPCCYQLQAFRRYERSTIVQAAAG
ncbi:hypothetical protein MLE07_21265 [Agrobacterium tumefaciens]|nr:hypothetical protein [Agrobacterium tumefaciens]UNZ53283.1 hypothetical protein MLE07_21265 [Agrobacterium tumefaciens]